MVVAEGLTSRTRSLVFPEADIRSLGLLMAYLTVPRTAADTDWWRIHQASQGRAVTLRPDNVGTIRATLSLLTDVRGIEDLDRPAQVHVLRRTFADAGWEVPRVLDALDDAPLYVDAVGQVRLPTWHRGRVVLLGDAAHCPSPITGMGTSLALVGAYVLAGELAGAADHEQALAAYETRMRPYVERAQQLPPGAPGLVHPAHPHRGARATGRCRRRRQRPREAAREPARSGLVRVPARRGDRPAALPGARVPPDGTAWDTPPERRRWRNPR